LKQSRIFWRAHVGVRLVVFGSKVAPIGTPKVKINLAPLTPKWGRYGGVKLFSSPPLPQNSLFRSRDFDGFEVPGGPPKNPENLVKIAITGFEILTQVYDEPMGPIGQGLRIFSPLEKVRYRVFVQL